MIPFKRVLKAGIYDLNHEFICDANVRITVEEEIMLTAEDSPQIEDITSDCYVTFYDDVMGLVTYLCGLAPAGKEADARHIWYVYRCTMKSYISQVQRRRDLKVKVYMPMACFWDENGKEITAQAIILNLSAGGLFCVSKYDFNVGQTFTFDMKKTKPQLKLKAEILRIQGPGEGWDESYKGYGCKFVELTSAQESTMRGYVYHEDLLQQRMKLER